MPLTMPALRDRSREDRLALITRLMGDLRTVLPDGPPSVTGEVLERLLSYPWPGNVREMRTCWSALASSGGVSRPSAATLAR